MRPLLFPLAALLAALPVPPTRAQSSCPAPGFPQPLQRLTVDPERSWRPVSTAAGGTVGIAWQDLRDGNDEIYFARLTAEGVPVVPPLRVSAGEFASEWPDIVWTGTEFGIVWEDRRDQNAEIYFARIDATGGVLQESRLTFDPAVSGRPQLAWNGDGFGVAWSDERHGDGEIYFLPLSADGTPTGVEKRVTTAAGDSREPRILWTGTEYLLIWVDDRLGAAELFFQRLNVQGEPLGGAVRVTTGAANPRVPRTIWTGTEVVAVWKDDRELGGEFWLARLAGDGGRLGGDIRLTNSFAAVFDPALAWSGGEIALVWRDMRHFQGELYLATFDPLGSPLGTETRLTSEDAPSLQPALSWTGSSFLLAWTEERDGNREIYAGPIVCDCADEDGDGFGSCQECDDTRSESHPAAFEACDLLDNDCDGVVDNVAVTCGTGACARSGACVDGIPSCVSGSPEPETCNAFDDDCDGLTDEAAEVADCPSSCNDARPGLAPIPLTDGESLARHPAMVWNGEVFGVAWEASEDGIPAVFFSVFGPAGQDIGVTRRLGGASGPATSPAVVWTGVEFVVVWADARAAVEQVFLRRFNAVGVPLGGEIPLTSGVEPARTPELDWTGSELGVVWSEGRPGGRSDQVRAFRSAGRAVVRRSDGDLRRGDGSDTRCGLEWIGVRGRLVGRATRKRRNLPALHAGDGHGRWRLPSSDRRRRPVRATAPGGSAGRFRVGLDHRGGPDPRGRTVHGPRCQRCAAHRTEHPES